MRIILFLLIGVLTVAAQEFRVTVKWDEMAMEGDAESILQYYHDGKVEAIRGNLAKGSSDGNIKVVRTMEGGMQQFIIGKARGTLINVWIVNSVMDEDFATKDDYLMLANSKAMAVIEDFVNQKVYQVQIPPGAPGLAFRAGAIVDSKVYDFVEMFAQQRIYNVTLINAASGQPLEGVQVDIIKINSGETVAQGLTDETGYFAEKLDYGKYKAKFSKKNFIPAAQLFEMDLTELPVSMNFGLSPQIDKFRIVLTWGPYPEDLDAHLAGPSPDGGNFHIWWNNKTLIGGKNFLDIDDKNSYGPETITIYKPAMGEYTYAVHDYTNRFNHKRRDLSFSGARVDVYGNGMLQASFAVPYDKEGNVWEVFKITNSHQIVPLNAMYDERFSKRVIH